MEEPLSGNIEIDANRFPVPFPPLGKAKKVTHFQTLLGSFSKDGTGSLNNQSALALLRLAPARPRESFVILGVQILDRD